MKDLILISLDEFITHLPVLATAFEVPCGLPLPHRSYPTHRYSYSNSFTSDHQICRGDSRR